MPRCWNDENCLNGGTCEADEIGGPKFCTNCDPGFTGPYCNCKFISYINYADLSQFTSSHANVFVQLCRRMTHVVDVTTEEHVKSLNMQTPFVQSAGVSSYILENIVKVSAEIISKRICRSQVNYVTTMNINLIPQDW